MQETGSFTKYVNNKLNGSNVTTVRDKKGNLLTANADKADILNKYHGSVFTIIKLLLDESDENIKCRLTELSRHLMIVSWDTKQP